jgi:hypothetical protein
MVGAGQGRAGCEAAVQRVGCEVECGGQGREAAAERGGPCAVCSECGRSCRLVESAGFPRPRRRLHQTPTAKARV